MIPTFILQIWILGLFSLGILAAVVYLAHEWQQRSWGWDYALERSVFAPHFGANETTALLAGAILLTLLAFFGGAVVKAVLRLTLRKGAEKKDDPRTAPKPASEERIRRPD